MMEDNMKKIIAILFMGLFLSASSVFCLGPKIDKHVAVWDANTEADLSGYYLYWRTSTGSFSDTNRVMVLKSTTPRYDLLLLNLTSGTYFIAVSAYNIAGNESALSIETTWNATIPVIPKTPSIQ